MIGRNNITRFWCINIICGILINSIIFQSIPFTAAKPEDFFPDNIDKVFSTNYTNHQTMQHWYQGKYTGNGKYSLNYTPSEDGSLKINGQYDVRFWQKACEAAAVYNGTTLITVNQTDRLIVENSQRVGSVNLKNQFTNLFLGQTLKGNYFKLFFLEEIMYITGYVLGQTFEFSGYNQYTYQNEEINVTKMMWVGQIFYAGFICGMGAYPVFNCTFEYFYETRSGILVYSRVKIHQYLPDDPSIYQIHEITNELTALRFEGQKDPDSSNTFFQDLFTDPNNNSAFWPIIGMVLIVFSGITTILFIRKKSLHRQARAFLAYEEKRLYGLNQSKSKNVPANTMEQNSDDKNMVNNTTLIKDPHEKKEKPSKSDN